MKNPLLLIFCLTFSTVTYASPDPACDIAVNAFHVASSIRGLVPKQQVPCAVHSKAQIAKFLEETTTSKLPANKLAMEEIIYKALGIIPDSYNYRDGILKLYLSQIGGYYDPDKKHFIMADWMPASLQTTVAVHELTHSLQDQYWDLNKIIVAELDNGDELLARSALVEGDATAVMIDYSREAMGQSRLSEEDSVGMLLLQQIMGLGITSGDKEAPDSLKQLLLFPYTSGLRFVHSLLRKGDYKEVNKAFNRLPRSSREILHPEEFAKGEVHVKEIKPEELSKIASAQELLSTDSKPEYLDTVGEFTISSALSAGITDKAMVAKAAAGWAGDLIGIFTMPDSKEKIIVWKTFWDSKKDADEFRELFVTSQAKLYEVKEQKELNTWWALSNSKQMKITQDGLEVDLVWRVS